MPTCVLKGFLTFLVLWTISKTPMSGAQVARELQKRRGNMPSPGTIYPVIKDLKSKGFITDTHKVYRITRSGRKELKELLVEVTHTFFDMNDMKKSV